MKPIVISIYPNIISYLVEIDDESMAFFKVNYEEINENLKPLGYSLGSSTNKATPNALIFNVSMPLKRNTIIDILREAFKIPSLN